MLHISVQWDCEGSESTAMHHKYQFFGQPEKNDEAILGKSRFWGAFGYLWCFLAYFGSSKIFLKDQLIHNYIIVLWRYEKMCQFLENPNFEQISTTCPFGPLMFIHIFPHIKACHLLQYWCSGFTQKIKTIWSVNTWHSSFKQIEWICIIL